MGALPLYQNNAQISKSCHIFFILTECTFSRPLCLRLFRGMLIDLVISVLLEDALSVRDTNCQYYTLATASASSYAEGTFSVCVMHIMFLSVCRLTPCGLLKSSYALHIYVGDAKYWNLVYWNSWHRGCHPLLHREAAFFIKMQENIIQYDRAKLLLCATNCSQKDSQKNGCEDWGM